MTNNAVSAITGTKTEQNLQEAARNEALQYTKYMLYSDIAHQNGYEPVSRMFYEFAGNEKEHAELWLGYLDQMNTTEENLDNSSRGEQYEADTFYPEAARAANEEGFTELAEKFRLAGMAEKSHAASCRKMADELRNDDLYKGDADTNWVCLNCGYHTKGNMPPERCPLCSYPRGYFSKVHD